ncbi:MAG: hypothetical protein A2066_09215 [Bacteroidetes bacterium GWB2_41_8]|nr:MAG: hypothetical protein A2066_09215 [Bacteroidetes bacterium GWB2_41_8]
METLKYFRFQHDFDSDKSVEVQFNYDIIDKKIVFINLYSNFENNLPKNPEIEFHNNEYRFKRTFDTDNFEGKVETKIEYVKDEYSVILISEILKNIQQL